VPTAPAAPAAAAVAAAAAEAVPADRGEAVPVTSRRDETRDEPEPEAARGEPEPAAARAEPGPEAVEAQPAPATVRDESDPAIATAEAEPAAAPIRAEAEPASAPLRAEAEPEDPTLRAEPDPAAVDTLADPAPVPSGSAAVDPVPPPPGKGPDPKRQSRGRQASGGLPPMPTWPSPPPTGPVPTGGAPAGESNRPRPQQPAAQTRPTVAPSPAQPTTPPEAPPPGRPSGRDPDAAETKPRPGTGPLGVAPDGPEALLAAAEAAAAAPGPLLGTPARPPGTGPTETDEGATAPGQGAPDRRHKGRRARSLLRFTAPRRPDQTERGEPSSPDEPQPLADFDRLTQSIESVTEALGGQPLEFYERDLPQIAAAETARRVRADVVVLLLDNGEGLMEVSGGVGLTPAERRLKVEYTRDVMRELFRAGVGLIEDTDRVRGALAGVPGSRAETLVMVPLVHERLGFGVLMAGRSRSQTGVPTQVFTDAEIEVLMGFADAAAASLRTAVLLRHLKGQLKALEEDN
jgi:hypothetical protein